MGRINGAPHALAGIVGIAGFGLELGDLPPTRILRILQALAAQVARLAIRILGGIQLVAQASGRGAGAARTCQCLARRANAGVVVVEAEVLGTESLESFGLPGGLFVVQQKTGIRFFIFTSLPPSTGFHPTTLHSPHRTTRFQERLNYNN